MINRKIALSAISIVAALALTAGGAFALFTDSATATNNTFKTGNADLLIATDSNDVNHTQGTFGGSITGPIFENLLPGDSKDFYFWLKNGSSSPISLNLVADVSEIAGTQNLDNTLLVKWTCDTNFDNSLGDETSTAEFSPRAWLEGGNTALATLPQNQAMFCMMTGRLPSNADNSVSGQTAAFDVTYDGMQTP